MVAATKERDRPTRGREVKNRVYKPQLLSPGAEGRCLFNHSFNNPSKESLKGYSPALLWACISNKEIGVLANNCHSCKIEQKYLVDI